MEGVFAAPAAPGLLALWLAGLATGLTGCAVACLPVMGGWLVGRGAGLGVAARDLASFSAGRVLGYVGLGLAAATAGRGIVGGLEGGPATAFAAVAFLLAAVALVWPRRGRAGSCGAARAARGMPPLGLGVAMALAPCPPLLGLAAAAAAEGDPARGAAMGLAFGLGAAIMPSLPVLLGLGGLGGGIARDRPRLALTLRISGAAALALMGLRAVL
mgnify:CR=1 FL=1